MKKLGNLLIITGTVFTLTSYFGYQHYKSEYEKALNLPIITQHSFLDSRLDSLKAQEENLFKNFNQDTDSLGKFKYMEEVCSASGERLSTASSLDSLENLDLFKQSVREIGDLRDLKQATYLGGILAGVMAFAGLISRFGYRHKSE